MLHSTQFNKKTKKGVLKVWMVGSSPLPQAVGALIDAFGRPQVVREHYLRDDIYCGTALAAEEHRGEGAAQSQRPVLLQRAAAGTCSAIRTRSTFLTRIVVRRARPRAVQAQHDG